MNLFSDRGGLSCHMVPSDECHRAKKQHLIDDARRLQPTVGKARQRGIDRAIHLYEALFKHRASSADWRTWYAFNGPQLQSAEDVLTSYAREASRLPQGEADARQT